MEDWNHFVQRTLLELRNGAPIPEYFGCLIPLMSIQSQPMILPNSTPFRVKPEAMDDEFISLDVVRPNQRKTPKPPYSPTSESEWLKSPMAVQKKPPMSPQEYESESSNTMQSPAKNISTSFESEQMQSEEEAENYTEKFRSIGDSVFGEFWFPITTKVPRFTLESRLMANFKPSKYQRLFKLMSEKYNKSGANKLTFQRKNEA